MATAGGPGDLAARRADRRAGSLVTQALGDALGFLVEESVLYAFYAFRMSPNDPGAVLQTAVSVGGDVDTVAAMAGAMVGAAVGLSGLDTRLEAWSRRLNDQGTFRRHDLVALARDLG